MHAVERPHGDAATRLRQIVDETDDVHATPAASSASSTLASLSRHAGHERVRRDSVGDRERPDLRATQRDAVTAERVGDRADVCPRAHGEIERDDAIAIREEVERVDGRPPQRHLDLHPAPRELVRALAVDLHRRRGGDRQLDLAAKRLEARSELVVRRQLLARDDLSLRIAGGGTSREIDFRDVSLVQPDEPRRDLGRPAGKEQE